MTVTDQINILEKKIIQTEAQYDLDRKAAKISALSSNSLDKYEYLTGEDSSLTSSTVEQAKFEYSPLVRIFAKELDKDDQKEGLFKRLKNIENKNEEQLKAIEDQKTKNLNKINSETNKTKNLLIYNSKHSFYKYRLSEFNKISLINSKFNKIEECYNEFIALNDVDAEPENIKHKLVVLNEVSKPYDDLIKEYKKVYEKASKDGKSDSWKQKYGPKKFRALNYQPVELKTEPLSDKDRSGIKQPTQLNQLNLNKVSKPLSIELPRNDFISLIKDVVDNLDNKDYQTTIDKGKYDLKNAEKYLPEIITKKISKNEARERYNSLIKPDVDMLNNALRRSKGKRNNILVILDNIKSSFFEVFYFHYQDKSSETEESIAERTKLRRQRSDEIAKKEKKISLKLFERYLVICPRL